MVSGIIRAIQGELHKGGNGLLVGSVAPGVYDKPGLVLLTVDQREEGGRVDIEMSLTTDAARELASELIKMADHLDRTKKK